LVEKWATSSPIQYSDESWAYELFIAHQGARWGSDQELEACCKVLGERDYMGTGVCGAYLRAARRPKPPSLKEQALEELNKWREVIGVPQLDIIRNALEQLDD
jgi:hypothetical protein